MPQGGNPIYSRIYGAQPDKPCQFMDIKDFLLCIDYSGYMRLFRCVIILTLSTRTHSLYRALVMFHEGGPHFLNLRAQLLQQPHHFGYISRGQPLCR